MIREGPARPAPRAPKRFRESATPRGSARKACTRRRSQIASTAAAASTPEDAGQVRSPAKEGRRRERPTKAVRTNSARAHQH